MHIGLLFDGGVHTAVALRKDRIYRWQVVGICHWQVFVTVVERSGGRARAEFEARFGPRFMLPCHWPPSYSTAAHFNYLILVAYLLFNVSKFPAFMHS